PQTKPAKTPASTNDLAAATRKESKTVHLPPTKTKVDTEPGKSRTYRLSLAEQAAGSWRNTEDIKELLVISDNQIIRMYNNKVVETVTFQMYQDCPKSCLGNEEGERGLNCISIAEKSGDQCYLLLEMDRVKMHYRKAGTGKIYRYKRQF
ncbi:MAG: hypothetical protein AAF985_18405, partial [Bacteroidota bacterium]